MQNAFSAAGLAAAGVLALAGSVQAAAAPGVLPGGVGGLAKVVVGGAGVVGANAFSPQVLVNLGAQTAAAGQLATVNAGTGRVSVLIGRTYIADTASNASPAQVTAGDANLIGGAPGAPTPTLGAAVLSTGLPAGTLLTAGAASGGAPLTAVLGGAPLLGGR